MATARKMPVALSKGKARDRKEAKPLRGSSSELIKACSCYSIKRFASAYRALARA